MIRIHINRSKLTIAEVDDNTHKPIDGGIFEETSLDGKSIVCELHDDGEIYILVNVDQHMYDPALFGWCLSNKPKYRIDKHISQNSPSSTS